jgi:hypothetical protein
MNPDNRETFFTGYRHTTARIFEKVVPDELRSNEGVKALLARVFPKMLTDSKQRQQAGKWARLIQLHYKFNYSEKMTADEMGLPHSTIRSLKNHIWNAIKFKRLDGSGKYKRKNAASGA